MSRPGKSSRPPTPRDRWQAREVRRFERKDASGTHVHEIELRGLSFTTRGGIVGSGFRQEPPREFATLEESRAAAEQLAAQWREGGHAEVPVQWDFQATAIERPRRRFEHPDGGAATVTWENAEYEVESTGPGGGTPKVTRFPGYSPKHLDAYDRLVGDLMARGFREVPPGSQRPGEWRKIGRGKGTLVERLDRFLRKCRPEYYATLGPGIEERRLGSFERKIGRTLPPLLRSWFLWKDGESVEGEVCERFQDNWSLMSIDEAENVWTIDRDLLAGGELEAGWWHDGWVPFLEDGGGSHLCVDLEGVDLNGPGSGRRGQVLAFWHDDGGRRASHASMDLWLEEFVCALEDGRWSVDSDGCLLWG
ncbi:MAG: SMI1/KNR4 family protein [Planctomycetes bacterium]|nr:SMI1/KNR4 family protein [Planctomycetota bacterium]